MGVGLSVTFKAQSSKSEMKVYVPFKHNSIFANLGLDEVKRIEDCDVVLLWNDVNIDERAVINLARVYKKKTAVLQHGRKGSSRYFPPFNEEIKADKLLVWGDHDKRALIEAGRDPSRLGVVGSPILDGLPNRRPHEGINIVFCPEHWDTEVEENSWVKKELRKLRYKNKEVKITTKLIEGHDPKNYDNPVVSNRNSPDHLAICHSVLETADVVVGVSESTFELMAQAMDIPVVIMSEWIPKPFGGDGRYLTYRRIISPGSKQTDVKNLNKTILEQLANPGELSEERKRVVGGEGGPKDFKERIKYELGRKK
jgi:hypothetical protein